MTKIAPSQIARRTASEFWGNPDHQAKLAKGIYEFDTPGHGGMVAVIGVADIPEDVVNIAREHGLIEAVVRVSSGRRSRTYVTGMGHTRDSLTEWAVMSANQGFTVETTEVWVGEEDCDWATLAYAIPGVLDALNASRGTPSNVEPITHNYVRETCERWGNKEFVEALD